MIDRERVMKGLEAERRLYAEQNPRSQQAAAEATHLFGGVPMTWMAKTAGGFPLFLDRASGARVTTSTATSWSTSASATPARWPGTRRPRRSPRSRPATARRVGPRR